MTEPLTPAQRRKALEYVAARQKFWKLDYFQPYEKQLQFLALGGSRRERLLMAGNRCGKTQTGAFEAALHATGLYPPWWKGRKFDNPVNMWVCGDTAKTVRDVVQEKLCGPPGVKSMHGTGMIPKDLIVDISTARGIQNIYDTIQVKHVSGGISLISQKSYEQGREQFQGTGLDAIWFDEEPPEDIYAEGLTRLGERAGISWMTFTPIKGPTSVVNRFINEPSNDRAMVTMTIDDIPQGGHISAEEKQRIIERYLPHEREARARGIPAMGSGRVFLASEESISESPIEYIPAYWTKLWGVDFGIGHPFAAVLILWDKDNDCIHVHATIRISDALPLQHWAAMKPIGAGVPVAWPMDGTHRRDDGKPLSDHYKRCGAQMLAEHATWERGGVSTEAGILEMDERFKTGKLKIARQLSNFFEEYRFYHRKDGKINPVNNDILDALRVALMCKRYAKMVPLGGYANNQASRGNIMAKGVDFDVFSGGGEDVF